MKYIFIIINLYTFFSLYFLCPFFDCVNQYIYALNWNNNTNLISTNADGKQFKSGI